MPIFDFGGSESASAPMALFSESMTGCIAEPTCATTTTLIGSLVSSKLCTASGGALLGGVDDEAEVFLAVPVIARPSAIDVREVHLEARHLRGVDLLEAQLLRRRGRAGKSEAAW